MCKVIGLAAAAAVLVFAGSNTARAQGPKFPSLDSPPDFVYQLSYYSNAYTAGAPDATLRLVNDGFNGDASPGATCAHRPMFLTMQKR